MLWGGFQETSGKCHSAKNIKKEHFDIDRSSFELEMSKTPNTYNSNENQTVPKKPKIVTLKKLCQLKKNQKNNERTLR